MTRFCKDCKHFDEFSVDGFIYDSCKRPTGKVDLVYGTPVVGRHDPSVERSLGECGPEGKHFEKRCSFSMRFLKRDEE